MTRHAAAARPVEPVMVVEGETSPVPAAWVEPPERAARRQALRWRLRWTLFAAGSAGTTLGALGLLLFGAVALASDQALSPYMSYTSVWVWAAYAGLSLAQLALLPGVAGAIGAFGYALAGGRAARRPGLDGPLPYLPWLGERWLRRVGLGLTLASTAAALALAFLWRPPFGLSDLEGLVTCLVVGSAALAFSGLLGASEAAPPLSVEALPAAQQDEGIALAAVAAARPEAALCPVCGCLVEAAPLACVRCGTLHHAECWEYAGGCAIFGCESRRRDREAPATADEVAALQAATARWLWLSRAQWWAFAAAVAGTTGILWSAAGALANVPMLLEGAGLLGAMTGSAFLGGTALAGLGALAWSVLAVPARWAQARVAAASDEPLQLPRGGSRAVLDRLDPPVSDELLRSGMGGLAVVSAVLLFVLLGCGAGLSGDEAGVLFQLVLAVLFPLGVCVASGARLRFMASVQNRLAASLGKRKGGV